ncbi:MAG: carboxypeptidase-like regulatory domain-containing protein, partial [Thermoanaerobaculia bacterium]
MRRSWLAAALAAILLAPETQAQEAGLSGVVLAGPDQPLAGARVELAPVLPLYEAGRIRIETADNPKPSATVTTGADGRFRLTPPAQGSWKVVVRAAGRVPVQYPLLWVEPGIELSPVTPPKDGGVSVKVQDAAGRPVPDAWVLATDAEEIAAARRFGIWKIEPRAARTGPDGAASLPAVEQRPLELHILAPGRGEEIRQGFTGGTVKLTEPASTPVILKIENAGAPAAGVQVRLGTMNWPLSQADARGEVRLPVSGSKVPRLRLVTSDGRQKVIRPADRAETLRIPLAEPRVLTGRVVDAAGKALKGALLSPDADPGAVLKTDAEGRYRLALPGAGPLSLEVRAAGYLPKRLGISAADLQAGRIPSLSLERATSVRGIVLDANRRPLPGVTIEAVPSGVLGSRQLAPREPVVDRVTTDAAGRFLLRRLRGTETYEVRARKTGLFTAAQLVAVPAGGLSEKKLIQFRLNPVRSAQGRIADAEGKAI